ncbi:hypothetical protein AAV98_04055 [Bacillus sp. CHD6a]|nr:hypothetical protein AAV98_04055 [Bacillus sp. CHD6a]
MDEGNSTGNNMVPDNRDNNKDNMALAVDRKKSAAHQLAFADMHKDFDQNSDVKTFKNLP